MRVAVTGSHRVGKTTLAQAIADSLGDHDFADEPYHELVADGYLFSHPPDPDDFEAQLEYALDALGDEAPNVVFDRCPVDLLAYLMVTCQNDERVIARWRDPVRRAMRSLDAVVFVPVEAPDVIDFGQDDDPTDSRGAVDEALRELLLGDHLELEVEILEVRGPLDRRTTASLEWLAQVGQDLPGFARTRRDTVQPEVAPDRLGGWIRVAGDGYASRVIGRAAQPGSDPSGRRGPPQEIRSGASNGGAVEEIDAGIEELHQSWRAAIRTGDIEGALGLLTDDYVLWASGTPAIRGRESVRAILRAAIERFRIDPSFEAEECLLSGNLAIARGWDVQAIEPREGGETLTQRQRVFLVMRREQDGQWRYARGMSQPGPQPA